MDKIINIILVGAFLVISADDEPDPSGVNRLIKEIEIVESSEKEMRENNSREAILDRLYKEYDKRMEELEKKREEERKAREEAEKKRIAELEKRKKSMQTVRFTNFYVGDGTGSGANTSVGLTVDNFGVNERGWYTYKGKVVIATATTLCLNVKSGPCGRYNHLPKGYTAYDLWDEVVINVDGKDYEAIVLSSCGACFWEEKYQRVDIFVSPVGKFGNKIGEITRNAKN